MVHQAVTNLSDANKRIAELEAQLAVKSRISWKIGEKGALSVYGLQRFPVTLYGEQWLRLFNEAPAIVRFIGENKASLATKQAKVA